MKFGKLVAVAAALSLSTAPAMAQAVQAVAPSSVERVGTVGSDEAELEGGSGILIALLAAAAVIAGIIIIADDDDPTSP